MTAEAPHPPLADLLQIEPGLSVLRLAALYAGPDGRLDDETLDLMFAQVQAGVLATVAPRDIWQELALGLMAPKPSNMLRALFACSALHAILPEVATVFGVPQIADDPPQVDIGQHLLRVLDLAAAAGAPLSVRFAALVMHAGKSDSPPEHLPVHYRHVERGRPRIEALCERFDIPDDCRELALLALAECERVHRVTQTRAGPVAVMLERLGAFEHPERFERLMTLCACDYGAYRGRTPGAYPKAALLRIALQACTDVTAGEGAVEARAAAIAAVLRSERWTNADC
ncbi:tRNA nucleotidyltransferase [Methylotetracoccus oryzae]|uniref:tRNA nucleotidyltransferase n=1 Tax=Methylotetracoccus oryzae TaxID=1919059 RepID=UPI00111B7826|nr:tRNA nucleotidyltransferase [Methylotetracoccus oryzae]